MSDERIRKNQITSRNSIEQNEHEPGPLHAKRTIIVDEYGAQAGTGDNPLKVEAQVNVAGGVDTPNIYNIQASDANTEYSQLLPAKTRHLTIKIRDNSAIMRVAFSEGDTDVNWLTVGLGNSFHISDVDLTNKTVYFQVNKPGKIIEILTWS